MKNLILIYSWLILGASLTSCQKISSTLSADSCAKVGGGYFLAQNDCVKNSKTGLCANTVVQSNGQNIMCWQSTASGGGTASVGGTTVTVTMANTDTVTVYATPTPTSSPAVCSTPASWALSAWSPTTCGPGDDHQTRTTTCSGGCPCSSPQPATTQTCVPDLYNAKHYESECTFRGGTSSWVDGKKICSISGDSCPNDWFTLTSNGMSYTVTQKTSGTAEIDDGNGSYHHTVYTGEHSGFTATAVESFTYCSNLKQGGGCNTTETIYAKVIRTACY